jgi:hypothetical protein
MDNNDIKIKKFLHEGENVAKIFGGYDFRGPYKNLVIVKDLPLYKGVGPHGHHGVAPVSSLVS